MQTTSTKPTIDDIRRVTGIAGQFSYKVYLTYPYEEKTTIRFYASAYGMPGPIFMSIDGRQHFDGVRVNEPERFGTELSAEWVRNFFSV
jgi:hypothetical protein